MGHDILDSELDPVYTEIMAATRPDDVFGSPSNKLPLPQKQAALKAKWQELSTIVDPNLYTRIVDANAAADARTVLERLYEQAYKALTGGSALLTFAIEDTSFHVGEQIAVGESSVLHRAIATQGSESSEVVIKIAKHADGAAFLKREAEWLRFFHTSNERHPIARVRKTLPKLINTFEIEDQRALVLPYYHGYRSVRQIVDHFDYQLTVGHAAWIARRVLALSITAQMAGAVHTAVTKEHVLVHPITHEPMFLGWGHASTNDSESAAEYDNHAAIEIAFSLFADASGTLHEEIPKLLAEYLEDIRTRSVRRDDQLPMLNEFTELVYQTLGKQYRPLKLTE